MAAKRTPTKSQPGLSQLLTPKLPQTLDRRSGTGEAMVKLFDRIKQGEGERRNFRERRATPRVTVGLPLEANAESKTDTQRLVTHDLSTFGLSISGGPTPHTGTRLTFKLFLPDEPAAPLLLDAEVLGPMGSNGGVRVKFIKPDLEAVRRIHKLVK